jgi:hypothetical protein
VIAIISSRIALAIASIYLVSSPVCAQNLERITDVELRAAYCLGVSTTQYERVQSDARKLPPNEFLRSSYNDIAIVIGERRDRFRDYLQIKGVLRAPNASAIQLALRRGAADATQCGVDIENPEHKACTKSCPTVKEPNDYRLCDAKCPPSEACVRVKRCLENFLPF